MAVVATAATEFEHVSGMASAAARGACIELSTGTPTFFDWDSHFFLDQMLLLLLLF